MLATLTVLGISFVLGSIPSAIWVGKLFKGVDVREHGALDRVRLEALGVRDAERVVDEVDVYVGAELLVLDDRRLGLDVHDREGDGRVFCLLQVVLAEFDDRRRHGGAGCCGEGGVGQWS